MSHYRYIYRHARTGEIVSEAYARRFPHLTVREVVPTTKFAAQIRALEQSMKKTHHPSR